VRHGLSRNDGQGWDENFDRPALISPQVIRLGSPIPAFLHSHASLTLAFAHIFASQAPPLVKPRRLHGTLLAWAVTLSSEGWFPVAVAGRFPKAEKWPANGHKLPDGEAGILENNEMLARLESVSFYTISNCWTRAMRR
jgi:hypothetical protein